MGFVEETGAAQFLRDARIAPIYEGTNGIQAADLVTRKLNIERGGVLFALMDDIVADADDAEPLAALARDCKAVGEWMLARESIDDRLAGSVPFLTMCAVAVAGWQLLRQARAAEAGDAPGSLAQTKPVTARFFLDHIVPEAAGLKAAAMDGADVLYALDAETLAQ